MPAFESSCNTLLSLSELLDSGYLGIKDISLSKNAFIQFGATAVIPEAYLFVLKNNNQNNLEKDFGGVLLQFEVYSLLNFRNVLRTVIPTVSRKKYLYLPRKYPKFLSQFEEGKEGYKNDNYRSKLSECVMFSDPGLATLTAARTSPL
ncbi:hypothetical protein J6590_083316 [Homalodisca vitripennis]|nr:hypothetical protein J6590_083316 [Homalodisca vitripennis]